MFKGFWGKLERPIVGLSPMDGVTDAAFRFVTAKYGRPSVIFTEFTAAAGLARGVLKLLTDFKYSEVERPVVAQVFGADPEAFYQTAFIVGALGFDGMDVNMGCPEKSVSLKQGAGAGLIRTPSLAREIIRAARGGLEDFARGKSLAAAGLPEEIIEGIIQEVGEKFIRERRLIPLSVKTRLGFNEVVVESWVENLLVEAPAAISLHGRTLRQLYSGAADWEAIGRGVGVARGTGTLILGNGDVQSLEEAHEKIEKFDVDGVLIGRASFGNPWIFQPGFPPPLTEKLGVMLEQLEHFSVHLDKPFAAFKKNFGWYCRGFDGAAKLRESLMATENFEGARLVADSFLRSLAKFGHADSG